MDKIYIVTTGSYSDYSIESVHTDKAMAERVASEIHGHIEEWRVDERTWHLPPGHSYWRAMMLRNGDMASAYDEHDIEDELNTVVLSVERHSGEAWISSVVSAKDDKHAIKILNERRSQILAMPILLPEGKYHWPEIVGLQPAEEPDTQT